MVKITRILSSKDSPGIIQNRKPGRQGQSKIPLSEGRVSLLCHRPNLLKVSGVRFRVSVINES